MARNAERPIDWTTEIGAVPRGGIIFITGLISSGSIFIGYDVARDLGLPFVPLDSHSTLSHSSEKGYTSTVNTRTLREALDVAMGTPKPETEGGEAQQYRSCVVAGPVTNIVEVIAELDRKRSEFVPIVNGQPPLLIMNVVPYGSSELWLMSALQRHSPSAKILGEYVSGIPRDRSALQQRQMYHWIYGDSVLYGVLHHLLLCDCVQAPVRREGETLLQWGDRCNLRRVGFQQAAYWGFDMGTIRVTGFTHSTDGGHPDLH